MQVRKQQLELDMEQQTDSKSRQEYVKAVYCHPAYLTYMQSISAKCWAGWSTSWNQGCCDKHLQSQICRWHHLYGRKWRRTKEPLDESERGEWKHWLKTQHSKNKDHGIWSHHFMANRWGKSRSINRFYFLGLQNHCRWWLRPWNKMMLASWKKSYDKSRQNIKKKRYHIANKCPYNESYGFSSSFWSSSSKTLATWCKDLTHWKIPWCWERLKTGSKGGNWRWNG